jgi:hypothetical protein
MPRPSRRDGNTLEERTAANLTLAQDDVVTRREQSTFPPSPPALCGHPHPCATITGVVEPYFDGAPPRRALYTTNAPVSKTLELM